MGRSYSLCLWERIKTRSLSRGQAFTDVYGEGSEWYRSQTSNTQYLIHQTMILTWIGELELATKIWEEGVKKRLGEVPDLSLGELLFTVVISDVIVGWGLLHPEFEHLIDYRLLDEWSAFRVSTTPFSELLKMDKPSFTSADGYVSKIFDKGELLRLAKIVPQEYHSELRLPFLVIRPMSYLNRHSGQYYKLGDLGDCQVLGSELENFVLQKLLRLTNLSFQRRKEMKPMKKTSHLSMLSRRRFTSLLQVLPEYSAVNYAIVPYERREKLAELLKSMEQAEQES